MGKPSYRCPPVKRLFFEKKDNMLSKNDTNSGSSCLDELTSRDCHFSQTLAVGVEWKKWEER
uniref:Uncharacterized protein n=1 Tax=Setaria digitata TaxID=48799 RepID=A0A915PKK0_9BILA